MADNPADETILDGDDDNEYTLDNEKEDALLADFEFDTCDKDAYYSKKILTQKSREVKPTEQNKNEEFVSNTSLSLIENTVEDSKLEYDYDIARDTDNATVDANTIGSHYKTEEEGIKDDMVESQSVTSLDGDGIMVSESTLIQNRLLSPTNEERLNTNDDDDEIVTEATDDKPSDDDEERDKDERDRFKTERSTILSIGKSGRTWDNLPDSLDDVVVPNSEVKLLTQFTRNKKCKLQSHTQKKIRTKNNDVSSAGHHPDDISFVDSPQRVSVIIQSRAPKLPKKQFMMNTTIQEGEWGVGPEGSIQYASDVGLFDNAPQHHEEYHSDIPRQPLPPSMQHLQQPHQQQQVHWQMQQSQPVSHPPAPHILPPHHMPPAMRVPQILHRRHEPVQPTQIPLSMSPLMQPQQPRIQLPAPKMQLHPQVHPSLQQQPPFVASQQSPPRPVMLPPPHHRAPAPPIQYQEMPPRSINHIPPEHLQNQPPQFAPPRSQLITLNNSRPPLVSPHLGAPPRQIIHRPLQPNTSLMPGHPISSSYPPPQQHLMQPPLRGTPPPPLHNFPPPQLPRHPHHLSVMRPGVTSSVSGALQQHPLTIFPDQQNAYPHHEQFPSLNHGGLQFPPLLHPNEPPPPGEHDSVQMFPPNTLIGNHNPHIPSSTYNVQHENPYREHDVNTNAMSSYNTIRARENTSFGRKRYIENNHSPVKRTRYEPQNTRRDDSSSWKGSQANANLIHLKPHPSTLNTKTNPQENATAISRIVHQVHPTEKKKIVIPSSSYRANRPEVTSTIASKNINTKNTVTVSSSKGGQVTRSAITSSAVTSTTVNSSSDIQNIAKMATGVGANINAGSVVNKTNVHQEVHRIFRLKTKGGKIMYKSVPVDPKTLQYKTQTTSNSASDSVAVDSNQNPRRLVVSNISSLPNAQQGVVIKENSAVEFEKIRQAAASVSKKYSTMTLGERFSQIKPPAYEDDEDEKQRQQEQQTSQQQNVNLNSKNLARLVVVANSSSRVVNSADNQSCKVVVKNIAASTKSNQISRVAATCGKIKKITWNAVSSSQNEAEIIFNKPEEAVLFCGKYNRKMIDLSLITVSIVKE